MLRSALLYLSRANWAKSLITNIGPARRSAERFVAGETLPEAVEAARRLNGDGLEVALDHLGESVTDEQGAVQAAQDYLNLLDAIANNGVRATASLKLTQLGLDISEQLCLDNMRRILERAKEIGNHITIDMESSDYVDSTLRVFRALRQDFTNVGTVIQAYLLRSEEDMRALAAEGAFVRLCKGAYKEPPDRAFPKKAAVDANFVRLIELFLSEEARAAGAFLAIATHDEKIVDAAKVYIRAHNVPYDSFEFQMLYGIRPSLQAQLRDDGFTVRVYAGYGTEWYPFFMRRLAERPANVWFIASNFFRR
ncbi:MAG: proline dehydrogenase family protein [Anaerolineae bacterium]|nr:proline dehydrogenase family protein [Anaerolineae bacterium]MEB2286529.1 proline dehydrogenase family protein [Anaerolineae bacterium]